MVSKKSTVDRLQPSFQNKSKKMSQVDLIGASHSVSTTGTAAATAVQSPLGGRVKKSGKLVMENPKKKFFQKSSYKRFVVLTSKKILCFKDSEVSVRTNDL